MHTEKILLDASAAILYALMLLIVPLKWSFAALTAAMIHEIWHIAAVKLCGGTIHSFSVGRTGMVICADAMSDVKRIVCSLAGPVGSLLTVIAAPWIPRIAFCAAVQGIYNLLPIYPLDGGRAFLGLAKCFMPEKRASKLSLHIENTCFMILFLGTLITGVVFYVPVLFMMAFLIAAIAYRKRKIPCKDGRQRVQ